MLRRAFGLGQPHLWGAVVERGDSSPRVRWCPALTPAFCNLATIPHFPSKNGVNTDSTRADFFRAPVLALPAFLAISKRFGSMKTYRELGVAKIDMSYGRD